VNERARTERCPRPEADYYALSDEAQAALAEYDERHADVALGIGTA
jgi:hypothetical protein